ncbi:hypothetical protein OEA41_004380 [Lepraria neglecta]|uniref:AB hydrolase-1 domain-containing protein n=1 Tax=Lepraria neglecta TaxID=209136 RepID=A0AAE0DFU2_9LECA|nr:hypothetical protein OEA41_004380 [Lepraria neglecta]
MARTVYFAITCLLSVVLSFFELGGHLVAANPGRPSILPGRNCTINEHPDVSDLAGASYVPHVRAARLPSGRTYRYVHYSPHGPEKLTVLFLHGFPSSAYDWRRQFAYFAALGYGVLAPDLLGYGGTDKPADVGAYTLKTQAREIVELLDCAGVGMVMSVGHDLGSPLLSRIATYYPTRSTKYVFLDIGYVAPPLGLTAAGIAALNAQTLATEGYEPSGYWSFFNETGAGLVLDTHDEAVHNRIFAPERGGYDPALNHYRALYRDLNLQDENVIPKSATNLTKPVLLLTAAKDPVGTPARAERSTRPYAPDLWVQEIDSGHFLMLEKADEVNKAIKEFFENE